MFLLYQKIRLSVSLCIVVSAFISFSAVGQTSSDVIAQGQAAASAGKYREAEEYFTRALLSYETAEIYFERALSRKQLKNDIGYANDLRMACALGDKRAITPFIEMGGKIDSVFHKASNPSDTTYFLVHFFDSKQNITTRTKLDMTHELRYLSPNNIIRPLNQNTNDLLASNLEISQDEIYKEEPPEFVGGTIALMKYVNNAIKMPASVRKDGKNVMALVKFIINDDGSISNISVVNSVADDCKQEAIRIISEMPKWTPAKQNGKPVKVWFNLPIKFKVS